MNDVGPDEEDHTTSNRAGESEEQREELGSHKEASTPPNCTDQRNIAPSYRSKLTGPITKQVSDSERDPKQMIPRNSLTL